MPDPVTAPLLRRHLAPEPRTLVDIFRRTVAQHPDAPGIDTGHEVLSYAELAEAADGLAAALRAAGIGAGDRVGVRIPSGTTTLYVAVLGVLLAGAAYVPVDVDDPDERARLVFDEADVAAVVGAELALVLRPSAGRAARDGATEAGGSQLEPSPDDDAWVIFTSGSTGTPKGVAVTHRNAAAFVDAEARLFLQEEPIGVGDRVMAGLSVAFDASCEEMWLAWRHGACLVPAPRALVRSGLDVGPWLVANDVTVVSTVPTLVALWPVEALLQVRLLILGGEACPVELAARLVAPGREVWNTYGPTEATVVACAAELTGIAPVRIGLPLDGWDLAVVDPDGHHVAPGETGELVIGGVGLARYLDPAKDAEKYAPMPTLGWDRAYRSGDHVVFDPDGLLFAGRADDQVKLGGRRIELGEIDSALLALPGVQAAAATVQRTDAGNQLLVGYVTVDDTFAAPAAREALRTSLPAALVPRLAVVPSLPTRTSGKVDRAALPWPLPDRPPTPGSATGLAGTSAWVAEVWREVLGAGPTAPDADFFDLGGGSLTAAQVVSRLRARHPEVTVGDLYEHPTIGALATRLDRLGVAGAATRSSAVRPVPPHTGAALAVLAVLLRLLAVPRWLTWTALTTTTLHHLGLRALPAVDPWVLVLAGAAFLLPPGRMLLAAGVARVLLAGLRPGTYPRAGATHVRLWAAERAADELGAVSVAGAGWTTWYARLLGAEVGRDADLHSLPPITGMLRLGKGSSVEPEVDLAGHWVDGDEVHIGTVEVGARARVGTRSTLCPGAAVGADAEVAPGSAVFGAIPDGEYWSGSPAARVAPAARGPWAARPTGGRVWTGLYRATGLALGALPVLAAAAGVAAVAAGVALTSPADDPALEDGEGLDGGVAGLLGVVAWVPVGTLVAAATLAVLVVVVVRSAARAVRSGVHPVRSASGLAVWATIRVLDEARTWLFPLYSSQLTAAWLRLLGARIGREVEASTVLLLPSLTQVNDQAFLADDTLLGGYELGGGWLRVERVKIGKRAFLGNSGMAAPGRKVPKASLVAVLSAAPRRASVRSGESWLGSPPAPLRRDVATAPDDAEGRTYDVGRRLRLARGLVECGRLLPVVLHHLLVAAVAAGAALALGRHGVAAAAATAWVGLLVAGLLAAASTAAAKWLLVGRARPGGHPLWSSFVWRNELADTFVEVLAAPWFARPALGTPLLGVWFRALGARIGRGVWCETYWLPESDLVSIGDGATVNRGTVVQTHLFHDRLLVLDTVVLRHGSTLGPNSVVLPAAVIGHHATVGPVSLVMRGESLPDGTAWIGNPIGPWSDA